MEEFSRDWSDILQVKNGPLSEKDSRRWSTGILEYRPDAAAQQAALASGDGGWIYRIASPYVLIDAHFEAAGHFCPLSVDVSAFKRTWTTVADVSGAGKSWLAKAADVAVTAHGAHNTVAGTYGYLLRLHSNSKEPLRGLLIRSTFKLNPRTLPDLQPGPNRMDVTTAQVQRHELPVQAKSARHFALAAKHVLYHEEQGQGYLQNEEGSEGELIFALDGAKDGNLRDVDAGGCFLDLSGGLAPNKMTAETRPVTPWPASESTPGSASIAWSTSEAGPWTSVWTYASPTAWPDGAATPQELRWPQIDKKISDLTANSRRVYVRYRFQNIAIDDIRLAASNAVPDKFVRGHSLRRRSARVWADNASRWHHSFAPADWGRRAVSVRNCCAEPRAAFAAAKSRGLLVDRVFRQFRGRICPTRS